MIRTIYIFILDYYTSITVLFSGLALGVSDLNSTSGLMGVTVFIGVFGRGGDALLGVSGASTGLTALWFIFADNLPARVVVSKT